MLTSLPTDQEVPCWISGSAVKFLHSDELFHGLYKLVVSVFYCPLSMFCPVVYSENTPAPCRQQVRGGPPVVSLFKYVVHRNSSKPDSAISGITES